MKKLFILGLLFTSSTAYCALAIDVNVSSGTQLTNAAHTLTSPTFSTSGGNEVLVALIGNGCGGLPVVSLVTSGVIWTQVAFSSQTTSGASAEVWRSSTSAALSSKTAVVTVNSIATCGVQMTIHSYTGVDLTGTNGSGAIGAIGHQINASGVSHSPTCTLTTTLDQSFVVGAMGDFSVKVAYVASAADTRDGIYLSSSNDTEVSERTTSNVSGLTATTLSFTNSATTDGTAFVCAEIKAAASAAATNTCSPPFCGILGM